MKNFKILSSLVFFIIVTVTVCAAAKKDKEIPPWMEDIKVRGRSTYLIPKGAKREIIGSQVIIEAPNEYVARRIYELERYLEEQFEKIDEQNQALDERVEALEAIIEGFKKEASISIGAEKVDIVTGSEDALEIQLDE